MSSAAGDSVGTQNATNVVVAALLIFAGVAALAGVVTIAIVVTREISSNNDQPTLRALGLTRVQRVALHGPWAMLVVAGGGLVAIAGAVAASQLFPIGVGRQAEPDIGVHADWTVFAVGFAGLVVAVLAITLLASARATRLSSFEVDTTTQLRTSSVPEIAARAGLSPTVVNGLRFALQPGRNRTAVPVRSALLGAVFGVFGITAVLVFASSLNHLVTTPRLYGWTWDFSAPDTISNAGSCSRDDFGLLQQHGVGVLAVAC